MSWQAGVRYYAQKPEGGPDWGIRAVITFIIPEKSSGAGPRQQTCGIAPSGAPDGVRNRVP